MRRELWRSIRNSKHFYIKGFRFAGKALFFSLILNLCLGAAIYQVYFQTPKRHFYVTNGVTSPTELIAMDSANESSVPLLASDPDMNPDEKRPILE
jgi:intracellular multiplication protein IcmM